MIMILQAFSMEMYLFILAATVDKKESHLNSLMPTEAFILCTLSSYHSKNIYTY